MGNRECDGRELYRVELRLRGSEEDGSGQARQGSWQVSKCGVWVCRVVSFKEGQMQGQGCKQVASVMVPAVGISCGFSTNEASRQGVDRRHCNARRLEWVG